MASRNITFNLPEDLIKRAKIHAAQHDTTVNAVVRRLLEEALSAEDRAYLAGKRLLEIAERGPLFTGDPASISRDELHERR